MNGVSNGPGAAHEQASRPTLDDVRRQRGEGWQWAKAQTECCPQCGYHPGSMQRAALAGQLMGAAAEWRVFLRGADDTYLRTNPEPGVFSPLQYGAHVRDIVRVYGDRILVMLHEDNPVFPQFNPDETVWDSYNRLGREALADDLEAQARRLAGILGRLHPYQWDLTMTRDGGRDGVYTFTVAGLASYAVHEAHHHLLDARGALRSPTPGG
jgi:DinB superfamily